MAIPASLSVFQIHCTIVGADGLSACGTFAWVLALMAVFCAGVTLYQGVTGWLSGAPKVNVSTSVIEKPHTAPDKVVEATVSVTPGTQGVLETPYTEPNKMSIQSGLLDASASAVEPVEASYAKFF